MAHDFCREHYKDVMREVQKKVPKDVIKEAWAYVAPGISSGKRGEFHIKSKNFFWHDRVDCIWDAKAQGWQAYLDQLGESKMRVEEIRRLRNDLLGEDFGSISEMVRNGVTVAIKDLPDSLREALKSVGFRKSDIDVIPSEKIQMQSAYGDGYRAYIALVNLGTGKRDVQYGSWGGANMFANKPVDTDRQEYPIPENGAAIMGQEGGGRPVSATVYVNPRTIATMLPASENLSGEEKRLLNIYVGLTSAGRKDEMERMLQDVRFSVKDYKEGGRLADKKKAEIDAMIDSFVKRGYLDRNKVGAMKITIKGKNAVRG